MRVLWFLPLTYLAGIEGFGWFMPYLLLVGCVSGLLARRRRAAVVEPAPQPEASPEVSEDLLEMAGA